VGVVVVALGAQSGDVGLPRVPDIKGMHSGHHVSEWVMITPSMFSSTCRQAMVKHSTWTLGTDMPAWAC
jgi:hypothetical protein